MKRIPFGSIAAVVAGGLGGLHCGGGTCVGVPGAPGSGGASTVPSVELRVVRAGVPSERVGDLLSLQPGDQIGFQPTSGVVVTAESGRYVGTGAAAVYTAAAGGDRLILRDTTTMTPTEWGWVPVRVPPSTRLPAACTSSALGSVVGATPTVYRRTLGAVRLDSSGCQVPAPYRDVAIYRIHVGEQLRASSPETWAYGTPEITSTATAAVTAQQAPGTNTMVITGTNAGWAAVHLVTAGASACRYSVLVDVVPADPVADAGVDAGVDAATDGGADAGLDGGVRVDGGVDAGADAAVDAGADAASPADVPVVDDVPADTGTVAVRTVSYNLGDVLPIGLVELSGGLFWYDNGGLALHRFDIATQADHVALASTSVVLRDLVAADGKLYWTTGPTTSTQVVGWRPGDAAPSDPVLTTGRAFDQLFGDGTRIYAHDPSSLQWVLNDGTGLTTVASSSSQRAFRATGDRIYFADLGLGASSRGVLRVAVSPTPTTLLGARDTVIPEAAVLDDAALPGDVLVDGATVYGLGHQHLLRAAADGSGTATEIARFPSTAPSTAAWTRMCLARGRIYMVEQTQGRLWSVPTDGSSAASQVEVTTPGVGFSLACTADSVWWWGGPRLYRYRLP